MTEMTYVVDGLADVELLLRLEIGLDATTVGSSLVQRAAQRRMQKRGYQSLARYAKLISDDAQELQELVEEVVVPETYFFREPEAIADIVRHALAMTPRPSAESPLRVLSVPCSSGEEPYSIAMALLSAGLEPDAIAIDAVDVSLEAVRRATEGVYRDGSFRGEIGEWKEYFRTTALGRELDESVRAVVRVSRGNLVDASFAPPREQYDVIFCRNLLIYFDTEAQSRSLAKLAALLAPDGVLVVGSADSFAARRAGFEPCPGFERSFLFRVKHERFEAPLASTDRRRAPTGSPVRLIPIKRAAPMAVPARMRAALLGPSRASVVAPPSADAASQVREISRLANEGMFSSAIAVGERAMRDGAPTAELFALMGTTYAAVPDLASAEKCYRRALFLDPKNEEALLHLSLLLEQRGEKTLARRFRSRAQRFFGALGLHAS
jgi:chemotaxis protein methyltransferase WspC